MTVTRHDLVGVRKLVHLFHFLCLEVIFTQSSKVFLKWGYPFPSTASWGHREWGDSPSEQHLRPSTWTKEHLTNI